MKHLLLFFILIISSISILAQTSKVDTVVTEKWNGTVWTDSSRTVSTYDENCQLTNLLIQKWNTTSLSWTNTIQTNFTYTIDDYVNESITQTWSNNNSTWKTFSKTTYTYDGSFKLLNLSIDIWQTNHWQQISLATYSYNTNGYTDSIFGQIAVLGLQNASLTIYTYNNDGTPSQILFQTWNPSIIPTWINSQRSVYTYNADKTVHQEIIEIWVGSVWINNEKISYTYNSSVNPLTKLVETWDIGASAWVNSKFTTNTYNGNGNLATELNQTWSISANAWDNDTRDIYTYSSSCTLPLKLIAFSASRNNNTISLTWQTTAEINTSHFVLQRSLNGTTFSNIGNVIAKENNTLISNYTFTDNIEKLTTDKVYYRLQMMDKDGNFTYSKIIPIALGIYAGNIKTYPNPVKDQFYILYNSQTTGKAMLRITDASGKIVRTETVSLSNNAISVNVSALAKGIYYVQLITDKNTQRTSFLKQ
jgi:Secretion system C-terminal sorting domain